VKSHPLFLLAALLFYSFYSFPSALHAQVPQIINHQGRVIVSGTNFTGTGQFKFALVSGSAPIATYWSNDGTSIAGNAPASAVSLVLSNGLYSVLLGDTSLANMIAIPAAVFTNSDVRLRVWFNDGEHDWQQLNPDQRIAAVGYAMMAGSVPDGSITSSKITPGAVTAAAIMDGAITGSKIASGSITAAALATGSTASTVAVGNDERLALAATALQSTGDGSGLTGVSKPVNVLPNTARSLNTTRYVRVMSFGDSFMSTASDALATYFKNTFGIVGYSLGRLWPSTLSGGATLYSQGTGDNTKWINSNYYQIPAGGVAIFDGGMTSGIVSNQWQVFYLAQPGGGSFKVEMLNSGTVTLSASTSTAETSVCGAAISGSNGSYANNLNRIKVTGLTGTSTVIGAELVNYWSGGGVILIGCDQGGQDLSTMTTSQAIVSPIIGAVKPDLIVYGMNDGASNVTTYLPGWITKMNTAYAYSDWLLIGPHPFSDGGGDPAVVGVAADANAHAISAALQSVANASGASFYDPFPLFGNYATAAAQGMLETGTGGVHMSPTGNLLKMTRAFTDSGLGVLANSFSTNSMLSSSFLNIVGAYSPSRIGGNLEIGRNDATGNGVGILKINDNSVSGVMQPWNQFFIGNTGGVLTISNSTWAGGYDMLRMGVYTNCASTNIPDGALLTFGGVTSSYTDSNLPSIFGYTGLPNSSGLFTNASGGTASPNSMYFQRDAGTAPGVYLRQGGAWKLVSVIGRTALAGGSYTVQASDEIVAVTGNAGATITLPSSLPPGKFITIKDEGGAAGATPITAIGTVDGVANPSITTNYGLLRLYTDGTRWFTR